MSTTLLPDPSRPVLHVLVVGFHHKKGCQVEYSHPPLDSAQDADPRSSELPSQWKHLPSLALPDGSHNYEEDTAYFHLPALDDPRKTVFGISCYRQIDADKLVNRTADITRGSVQKSVCVLSRLPLYGQIQVKMSLITEAYFREGDFSRLDLIHQTYDNLNACLTDDMLHTQQLYVGLSARHFVRRFRQRSLVLFKLLLLERKVLFYQSPVNDLCGFLLTLLSLHPGMLERGLDEAARMVPPDTPPVSPCLEEPAPLPEHEEVKEETAKEDTKSQKSEEGSEEEAREAKEEDPEGEGEFKSEMTTSNSIVDIASEKVTAVKGRLSGALGYIAGFASSSVDEGEDGGGPGGEKEDSVKDDDSRSIKSASGSVGGGDSDDAKAEEAVIPAPNFSSVAAVPTSDFCLPLHVFTGGNLCHPYLSLSYLDALSQPSVHGYLIGATNVLFKQKKGVAEVVVDIERDRHDVPDGELKRALQLSTEDLRFVDNVVKHVSEETAGQHGGDAFLDNVGWEGGDEWVRAQFRFYLVCLLRTSMEEEGGGSSGGRQQHLFNSTFMQLWRQTNNYRHWRRTVDATPRAKEAFRELTPGHPFGGVMSVGDVRLHLSNTMATTEGGKRVSQAVSNTTKAVAGGLSTAKGAFSSFLTSLRQPAQTSRTPSPKTSRPDSPAAGTAAEETAEEAKECEQELPRGD